jgi:hypothetical protein
MPRERCTKTRTIATNSGMDNLIMRMKVHRRSRFNLSPEAALKSTPLKSKGATWPCMSHMHMLQCDVVSGFAMYFAAEDVNT